MKQFFNGNFLKYCKKIFAVLLTALVLSQYLFVNAQEKSYQELKDLLDSVSYAGDYFAYREYPSDIPDTEYVIEAADYISADSMNPQIYTNYLGKSGDSVLTDSKGCISWSVNIEREGYYNIELVYCATEGKGTDIKRSLYIDGEIPFKEASQLVLKRLWKQQTFNYEKDAQGNEKRPAIIENESWQTVLLRDSRGYVTEPFQFYMSKGTHTITLLSQAESMMLRSIRFCNTEALPDYKQIQQQYKNNGYTYAKNQLIEIEAQNADLRSDSMLYPFSDRSSPAVTPYSATVDKINVIGGNNWSDNGQWIEWEFEVAQSGLYNIALCYLQNYMRGTYVARELSIDGVVPFAEMQSIPFKYNKNYDTLILSDGENPYQFYLTKGVHTLRMKVVLGETSKLIYEAEKTVAQLNEIYRSILMITGKTVDINRDYQIETVLPDIGKKLKTQHNVLEGILKSLEKMAGRKSDKEALIQTLSDQIEEFSKDVEVIPSRLDAFKTNIGGLSTWVMQAVEQPLVLDKIYVYSEESLLPKQNDGFFDKLLHEIKMLVYSFIKDYDNLNGEAADTEKAITVWVGTGRDQANTIKQLMEESDFEDGFIANLMLTKTDTLLSATLAGQGPDVAMQLENSLPMNYGMRNAVYDLSQFSDFEEIKQQFRSSSFEAFSFENRVFALPETQTFYMMFYRKDILNSLGIKLPETWDDVKSILPILNKNYLDFGMLPAPADMSYGLFLYQNGGDFYTEGGISSALSGDEGMLAFRQWTSYYTEYGFEKEFDFINRFRTGEMPIGIADYTTYNTLQVSAPEINGLWGMCVVPGVKKEDGTINRSVPCTGTAAVIMQTSEKIEASWEFLKWWTSADIQAKYGLEMENRMGASARYPTANKDAFARLPWTSDEYEILLSQLEWVKGIPQVPGGYFTARHLNNAFYTVINGQVGAREALNDHVRYINEEIYNKRNEFGLKTEERDS